MIQQMKTTEGNCLWVDRAPDHIAARKLLDAGKSPTFAQVGDEGFALAALLK